MRRYFGAAAAALLVSLGPGVLAAQTRISARGADLRVGGLLHAQYQGSSVDGAANDFLLRRARLVVDATISDFVDGRVQLDLASGSAEVLDAYIRMNFDEGFRLSFGQMKRSFDLFELSRTADLSIVERDGRIAGFSSCTGVGGVCSSSRLTEGLGYSDRDVGLRVDGSSGTFSYQGTLTNGTGLGVSDQNDGKSLSGRGSVEVSEDLVVSGNLGLHDYLDPTNQTAHAFAWGADVQMGTWRDGLLVQAGLVGGDNWRVFDVNSSPEQFLALQVVGSFYQPLDGDRIVGIEPVARVSIADPDGSLDDDGGTLITPGVMLYFSGRNRIGANFDYYMPSVGDSEFSLRLATFLYF